MTARRTLGSGPDSSAPIGAAQADLLDDLPGIRLPDLAELRARGVLATHSARPPAARRVLGSGGHPDTRPGDTPA
ncbi:hypothetical protein [Streptomyces capillispiralis]|uniref:Uncharacterized protein n=1 Tax=Streptomyces capillispiralis TaxID=68182 RepID=A0A561TRY0_9ACTN|nr:hypothetical protein [Streptomyces capillispiralis]TWF89869.1 hypothetical protein FHX78_116916 [Streptomyces capillispiralis]GHH95691.1 hypothetical protein GCM10017779_61480 [Streptomyces capillispiralis]